MTPVIMESIVVSVAVCVGFVISHVTSEGEDVIILAVLFIAYFLGKKFFPKHPVNKDYVFDSVIFTIAVVTIVVTSGGLDSPLFFLLYFLLFGLGLLLKPVVSLTTTVTIALLLVFDGQSYGPSALTTLLSLPMITPFATMMGNEFHKARLLAQKEKNIREDSFIFLSTVLKEHINRIGELASNFQGDHELDAIKRIVRRTQKLIERFEHEIEKS